jgi:Transposase DDE domain
MDRCLDRDQWLVVMDSIRRSARAIDPQGRRPRYPNWLIVAMYLWAVLHDRCLSWACHRVHYNTLFRPRGPLPSISQFTRRIKSEECRMILQRVHDDLVARGTPGLLNYIDAKALLVSPVSKDPDARRGHITGGFGKGYKFHAYITESRRVHVWCVTPLNTDEKTIAREYLLPLIPPPPDPASTLTLTDSGYDAAPLYKAFEAHGQTLLAPVRGKQFVGPDGRSKRKWTEMGPQRRDAVKTWENHPTLANYVMEQRNNAEGTFSVLSMAMGLHALPPFVRRLPRVRRWAGAKIILYHARRRAQEMAAKNNAA